MRRRFFFLLLVGILGIATAQQQSDRGPSTPDERKRFLAITHKMEEAPLDDNLRDDRDWALQWLIDIPDIQVTPCPDVLSGLRPTYRYFPHLNGQYSFSMAAFMIEHPEKAKDRVAVNVAGVEGALRAYQAILKAQPRATSSGMEELARKQKAGTLVKFVTDASKDCTVEGDQKGA
ncbi:MAG TPA: hypothetical protein VHN74_17200 [Candidatus Angelobacter sp.]|jgi:hypothetical protein|nr:hypothetical protein [Candidatus Angelobacter sp.]